MLIERITNAQISGNPGPVTLELENGRVRGVRASAPGQAKNAFARKLTLDAGGRVVAPAFVDAHVHLDKAFLSELAGPTEPRLERAIERVAELRGRVSFQQLSRSAARAVELLIKNGVTAARVHVELDPLVGLSLADMQLELAEKMSGRIKLQLVAFPQRGLDVPGVSELMSSAVQRLDVVGGCPYVDSDPAQHLDFVFGLAEKYGKAVDLHLDFSDDARRSLIALVAERTRAHGMQGKVTIGHVTTLASMSETEQSRALEQLAAAQISLVVLPATDLFLAGHGEPGTRSLAPIERAHAAGVRVAIANNNLQNPFAPFGNGNLLQAAWLVGLTRRVAARDGQALLLDAISHEPARILGLPEHGIVPGALADLVLLDLDRSAEAATLAPAVLATLHRGALSHLVQAPHLS
jgi:cytosine deaminase